MAGGVLRLGQIELVGGDVDGGGVVRARLGKMGGRDGEFICPSALALVPGLGLAVRELGNNGRLQFFATPDAIAMASMSAARVAWLACVARAMTHRRGRLALSASALSAGGIRGKKPRVAPAT